MNEKENTMRMLADQPLLIKSRWCLFNIHKWTQYGKPQVRSEGGANVDFQVRTCVSCNHTDVRVIRRAY